MKLTTRKELGGAGGTGVSPEQLFAIGYAVCFLGAMKICGVGRACRAGMNVAIAAGRDIIIFLDGDGSDCPERL